MKDLLKDEVDNVNINFHNQDDPMVVLAGSSGYSANMEKIIKAQATISKDNR